MATITKRKSGKWTAEVRTHKKYISKTFIKKSNASNWAKEIEYQLDREQYEDFSESVRITLGELITRYRDEITPTKKGAKEEKYKPPRTIFNGLTTTRANVAHFMCECIEQSSLWFQWKGKMPVVFNKKIK